jgi:hypothetical protein
MNEFDDPSELAELDALTREMEPPPDVEERLVSALKDRGMIAAPGSGPQRAPWWQLAAAALIAATLGWFGHSLIEPAAPATIAQHQFLLLLSEPETLQTTKPESELVEEYRVWANDLGRQGLLLDAQKLRDGGELLRPVSAAGVPRATGLDSISGFFLVRAGSWDEALDLARTCPHLAYGGDISVRMIEETG